MKHLFLLISLAIFLVSCANVPEPIQASNATDTVVIQDTSQISDTVVDDITVQDGDVADEVVEQDFVQENDVVDEQSPVTQSESPDHDEDINAKVKILGGDEETLREFMTRWLTPLYPSESLEQIVVSIGSLQEELPVELPMPDDVRFIAAVTGHWVDYSLVLDTGLSPDEVQDFYADELMAGGWELPAIDNAAPGFVPQAASSNYCFDDGNVFLSVGALSIAEGVTDLRLDLHMDAEPFMCDGGGMGMGYTPEHFKLIPPLVSPDGTVLAGNGSGGSDSDAEARVQLNTTLTASELVVHYNQQLESAGWEPLTQSDGDGAAWSTWSVTDEHGKVWSGTLFVIESSVEDNGRYAFVRIERNR